MRSLLSSFPLLLCVLPAGCSPTAPTHADGSFGAGSSASADASAEPSDASCTLALHAILREAGSTATFGQVQFRVDAPEPGSSDVTVRYGGVFGPTDDLDFDALSVGLSSRIPGQSPTWSDFDKSDPGTTLASVLRFGRVAPMSQAMALALVDDPTAFKAVVNVIGATGGREAEGVVEPTTRVPESLRERQRVCFGAG